jgi:hypothetical protein
MTSSRHLSLFAQAVAAWFGFWLAGLPHYYQQYSTLALAVASVLLSVAISLAAILLLRRGSDASRRRRAFWYAFYFTVPFAALDTLYCGWWLGRGAAYLHEYWYLTVFYLTPWLTFPPTARLLQGFAAPARTS